jgi:hypothetical protein
MDPSQAVTSVAQALGESSGTVEEIFRTLFRAYPGAGPADWSGLEQDLYAQPPLEHGKLAALLDALKALAGEAGDAEDPRIIVDDHELRAYFASDAQSAAADRPAAVPVAESSLIHQVGDAYYLGQDHQVWQAASGDSIYYHDGTQSYDTLGRPLDAPGAAPPATSGSEDPGEWNSYLAQNGPRWDGTEASWQQFRDWFLYDAATHQVGTSAAGFIALAESGEKRAVFADYGVALPSGSPPGAGTPEAPDLLDRLRLEVMEPALEHALNAEPALAALGQDRLRELLAEVTADHLDRYTA